jgi:hypothetical protein
MKEEIQRARDFINKVNALHLSVKDCEGGCLVRHNPSLIGKCVEEHKFGISKSGFQGLISDKIEDYAREDAERFLQVLKKKD